MWTRCGRDQRHQATVCAGGRESEFLGWATRAHLNTDGNTFQSWKMKLPSPL